MQKRKELACLSVLILVLSVSVFSSAVTAYAAYHDEGNDGNSWETAYVIDSVEDLILMRKRVNDKIEPHGKYYKLTSDLDLSSETGWGELNLYGYFDGQNHTIKLNSTINKEYSGLFRNASVSEDQVCLKNLNVTGYISGRCTGTLVHYLYSGIVENCSFNGTVDCDDTNSKDGAGGLISHFKGGTVRNCRVTADISGASYAGGIVGEMTSGKIENCTANVNLLNGEYRGGIVGKASGTPNLSGNTWPDTSYPQVGTGQEGSLIPSPDDADKELEQATISPVPELTEDIISRLAQNISVDPSEITLLTNADFNPSDPPEPTQTMRQEVSNQNGQFLAKLNTINVSKDGWYVFMVTVSDDLVGTSVSDLRLFSAEESDFTGAFKASFGFLSLFNGVTGMWEVTNLFGVELDTLPKQFLMTIMLSAGKSLTTYFVKILLMLLAGGCNAGIGFACLAVSCIIAVKISRKHKK